MKGQPSFADIEYAAHKRTTKHEEFLSQMDEIIPWDEWVGIIEPYYYKNKQGRPSIGIAKMLFDAINRVFEKARVTMSGGTIVAAGSGLVHALR